MAGLKTDIMLLGWFANSFGITTSELTAPEEKEANRTYMNWLNEMTGKDYFTLKVAMSPCIAGYRALATTLAGDPDCVKDDAQNPYWHWIEAFLDEEDGRVVARNLETLEKYALTKSPAELDAAANVFKQGIEHEIRFFDMFPWGEEFETDLAKA